MAAVSTNRRYWLLAWAVFQVGVVTLVVNSASFFFVSLQLWLRIALPVLLVLGFIGVVMNWRHIHYFGWAGVALFMLIVVGTAVPDESYTSLAANAPNLVDGGYALGRFLLLLQAAISLAVCFGLLARQSPNPLLDSPSP